MVFTERAWPPSERTPAPASRTRLIEQSVDIVASAPEHLAQLLTRVEASTGTFSIAFSTLEGAPLGSLLVTAGRPCLVRLREGQLPLGLRPSRRWPETAAAVRSALAAAKAARRPLGDVLASLGSVDSDRIREALLDQIADGLVALASAAPAGVIETWLSASPTRVPSVLSAFAPREVYGRAAPLLAPVGDEPLRRGFAELAEDAAAAFLCARVDDAEGLVLEARGAEAATVAEIVEIGRTAASMTGAPALLAAGIVPRVVLFGSAEGSVLCAATGRSIVLLVGLDGTARARALGRAQKLVDGHE